MIHRRSGAFKKLFEGLPKAIQELAKKNFEILKSNPGHASLDFKRLSAELRHIWSARVGNSWRVLGRERAGEDTIDWFWIGPHEEYNKLVTGQSGRRAIKGDPPKSRGNQTRN